MKASLSFVPEVAERLHQELALGKRPLKAIVNDALKRGLGLEPLISEQRYRVTPHSSRFQVGVDVEKLNSLVDELEVEEFQRSLAR